MLDSLIGGTDLSRVGHPRPRRDIYRGPLSHFKDGVELKDSKKAAKTVRQYVSGFANADGGLLMVGVSDGKPGARSSPPARAGSKQPGRVGDQGVGSAGRLPVARSSHPGDLGRRL